MPGPVLSPGLPEWLRDSSLASSLLSEPPTKTSYDNRKVARKLFPSQKRTVLLRDTELFIAHGQEIRCADLKDLKTASEKGEQITGGAYQSLELPNLDFDISQIIKSADGETMIVVGEYDVGIALLPAPGVVAPGARSKIALKYYKLGPDSSSKEKSKILRAIFHPLGARPVYEVEFNKEGSFVEPSEAFDLKHMLGIERSSSYLIDDVEPVSMCFGGVGSIWSIFTLYILMRNGEIYSICPFLPSKWMLDSDFMEELKYELQINQEIRDSADSTIPGLEKHNAKQICFWIHEISRLIRVQSLSMKNPEIEDEPAGFILPKPSLPEFEAPLLQGPYLLQPAPEEVLDETVFASDIARIGAAQYAVIAVAWSTGKVDLLLEFDGVAPRWHSNSLKYKKFNDRAPYPVISGYESINIALPEATETSSAVHPSFTVDINFPYTLLLNHGSGVELLNLEDWMGNLSKVMDQEDDEGVIEEALFRSERTAVLHAIGAPRNGGSNPVLGSSLVYDAYLGYVLIAATTSKPGFAVLQWPSKYHSRMLKVKQERSDVSSTSSRPTPALSTQPSQLADEDSIAAVQKQIADCRQKIQLFRQIIDPRVLSSEVQISSDNIAIITRLRNMLFEEMDARYASAQQIHAAAVQQQQRFHEQINNIKRFSDQLREREKQQEALREKVQKTTDTQQVLKERVDGILSKLSAISKAGGYSSMSQAEQDYVEETHGIEKIVKQINSKQQKMTEFLETLGRTAVVNPESQQSKTKTEQDKEIPDSNRQELSKMVQKEHRLIVDIRKKVDYLENQFQEIKLVS
ncbi:hypothetical protein H072_5906 [Dactylellina haptotyla CBS 200.50]|uniref:Uncharacterized protein n=1 Tax=Dactylellina haptotyla (strain CBS 200.50) TaxID=1284197 RepID=S8ABH0_DACHA|nr:hypothetical protein H072_5906 [Dactylellina haptotyla CBS 200.50]